MFGNLPNNKIQFNEFSFLKINVFLKIFAYQQLNVVKASAKILKSDITDPTNFFTGCARNSLKVFHPRKCR